MTPRQWLLSRFNAGAYPSAPRAAATAAEAATPVVDADADADADALHVRVRRALDEVGLADDKALLAHLLRVVHVQETALEKLPLHAPFAWDFDGAAAVRGHVLPRESALAWKGAPSAPPEEEN